MLVSIAAQSGDDQQAGGCPSFLAISTAALDIFSSDSQPAESPSNFANGTTAVLTVVAAGGQLQPPGLQAAGEGSVLILLVHSMHNASAMRFQREDVKLGEMGLCAAQQEGRRWW